MSDSTGTTLARYGAVGIKYLTRAAQLAGALIALLLIVFAFSGEANLNFFQGVAVLLLAIALLVGVVAVEILARGMDRFARYLTDEDGEDTSTDPGAGSDVEAGGGSERAAPDTDPRHLDPAGDVADAFGSGEIDAVLGEDADREELEEFLRRAEAGEYGSDPGVEAAVRIVRSLLDDDADDDPDPGDR